jgi:hypothetical protein
MIRRFVHMGTTNRRGTFSRAIAGVCIVLWMAGSISTLYGSLSPQSKTPHCPQSHSGSAQHTSGSCVWHCDSIDTQSFSGRSWRPSITPAGFLSGNPISTLRITIINGGITTRGPPQFLLP